MKSHESDLRSEVIDAEQVRRIQDDFHTAALASADMVMLDFAVNLSLRPKEMHRADIERLRNAGFSDEGILDIAQTTAYFNYANRVMDALGIELEPEMRS